MRSQYTRKEFLLPEGRERSLGATGEFAHKVGTREGRITEGRRFEGGGYIQGLEFSTKAYDKYKDLDKQVNQQQINERKQFFKNYTDFVKSKKEIKKDNELRLKQAQEEMGTAMFGIPENYHEIVLKRQAQEYADKVKYASTTEDDYGPNGKGSSFDRAGILTTLISVIWVLYRRYVKSQKTH